MSSNSYYSVFPGMKRVNFPGTKTNFQFQRLNAETKCRLKMEHEQQQIFYHSSLTNDDHGRDSY